jgi:HK97 family phage prohead protease
MKLYAYCERSASRAAKPGDAIRFVASTENVARDGMIIESGAWDLANYKRNPVVLWSHDMLGARPPIGRAEEVFTQGRKLLADIVFDQGDEFARQVEQKYRTGFLSAVSVSWDSKRMEPGRDGGPPRITKAELLEISAVPVPSDPGALVAGRSMARRAAPPLSMMPADYQRAVRTLAEIIVERWRAQQQRDRELSILLDLDGVPRR